MRPQGNALDMFLKLGWLLLTVGALALAFLTFGYYNGCTDCNFLLKKQDVVFNPVWRTAFFVHISGGILALLTGPLQFVRAFRKRFLRVHRAMGKVYVASILLLAGPTGQLMGFYAEGTWVSVAGFLVMAFLWMFTTYKAYATIRERNVVAHRDWMTRSFAITLAAVTLRIWVPLSSKYLHIDDFWVVETSAWISWIPNLLFAELLVRVLPKKL